MLFYFSFDHCFCLISYITDTYMHSVKCINLSLHLDFEFFSSFQDNVLLEHSYDLSVKITNHLGFSLCEEFYPLTNESSNANIIHKKVHNLTNNLRCIFHHIQAYFIAGSISGLSILFPLSISSWNISMWF